VQERTLSESLGARDVGVQSQTGTGKTAAFLITIFQLLHTDERFQGKRALIVAPTRELAVQIEKDAKAIGKHLPYRTVTIYGGVGYKGQEKSLREGVDLIIATPGRLLDLEQSKTLRFDDIAMLVIDEADRLFDMGFYPDVRKIFKKMPKSGPRVTMLFSATLGTRVRNLAWEYMDSPAEIQVEAESITVDLVDQLIHHVGKDEKLSALLGVLEREQPKNALVFTNTKHVCEELAKRLEINGYTASYIMGDIPQKKRLQIIDRIKSGELPILVATDVAARGLHIDGLDLVVNYDIPEDAESYVHRIGRTGRAGKRGKAVSLACERYVFSLPSIEEFIEMKIPVEHLGDEEFLEDQSAGMRIPRDSDNKRSSGGGPKSGGRSGGGPRSGGRSGGGPKSGGRSGGGDRRSRGSGSRRGDGQKSGARGSGGAGSSGGGGQKAGDGAHGSGSASDGGAGNGGPSKAGAGKGGPHKGGDGNRKRGSSSRGSRGRGQGQNRGPREKPREKQPSGAGDDQGAPGGPSKDTSVDERLAYYQQKYGEDFQVAGSTGGGRAKGGASGGSGGTSQNAGRSRGGTAASTGSSGASQDNRGSGETGADYGSRSGSRKGLWNRLKGIFGGEKAD
jgi:ATP-dependent RNA helicase RhlB